MKETILPEKQDIVCAMNRHWGKCKFVGICVNMIKSSPVRCPQNLSGVHVWDVVGLYSLIALGTKTVHLGDFLYCLLNLLLRSSTMLWRGWQALLKMAFSSVSILSSATTSRAASFELTADSTFLMGLFSLFASFATSTPQRKDGACHNRLIKLLDHLIADTE